MQRRTLNKGAALWKQGEIASTLAIVETGKLAVTSEQRLTGLLWPGMVIGENAILSASGHDVMRSANVFALGDGASVKELYPEELQASFESGDRSLAMPVLITLVGEISRNCLLLLDACKDRALITSPMKALMEATIGSFEVDAKRMKDWSDFTTMVALLVESRDYTDRLRAHMGVDGSDREIIKRASDAVRIAFKDHEALGAIQSMLDAELDRETMKADAGIDSFLSFIVRS